MLTKTAFAAWLALFAHTLAAAQPRPVLEGALGIQFSEKLPPEHLGASLDGPPQDVATYASVLSSADLASEHLEDGWHYFAAQELPRVLRDTPTRYFVQIDDNQHPVQIVAELSKNCDSLGEALGSLLTKKYGFDAESLAINAAFTRFQRWTFRFRRAFILCSGDTGWMSFLDPEQLSSWQRSRAQAAKQQQALELKGRIVQASRFAHGNRRGLDGAFGVLFAAPFPGYEQLRKDAPTPIALDGLRPPFSEGQFELTVSPNGYPFRIGAQFSALTIEWAAPLLEAKFGTPQKRTPKHIVHKVGDDFAILKKQPNGGLEMVFIDGDGQRGQRARADAAAEADWQDEVEGL